MAWWILVICWYLCWYRIPSSKLPLDFDAIKHQTFFLLYLYLIASKSYTSIQFWSVICLFPGESFIVSFKKSFGCKSSNFFCLTQWNPFFTLGTVVTTEINQTSLWYIISDSSFSLVLELNSCYPDNDPSS